MLVVIVAGLLGLAARPIPGSVQLGGPNAVLVPGTSAGEARAQEYDFANCRFGVAASRWQFDEIDVVSKLNVGWYLDFTANLVQGSDPLAYAPMIRISQTRGGSTDCGREWDYVISPPLTDAALGQLVDAMPGAQWLVGNEPERVGQDGVCPGDYARAYGEVYEFIKGRDPTALVFAGGVVEPTPMRLSYLDMVLDAYVGRFGSAMPVDGWAVHLYVLSETGDGDASIALGTSPDLGIPYSGDCADPETWCHAEHDDIDLVAASIVRMREWMRDRGYRDRPLLVTEFGILKPYHLGPGATCAKTTCSASGDGCFCDERGQTFHPGRVGDFAEAAFDLMRAAADPDLGYPLDGDRLVQQWVWFHLATAGADDLGHASNLAAPESVGADGEWMLTPVGEEWASYVSRLPPATNILIADVPTARGSAIEGSCSAAVELRATIANNGNATADADVLVAFYADPDLEDHLAALTMPAPAGCASERVEAKWAWEGLCEGARPFWVEISSEELPGAIDDNNVARGEVVVDARPASHSYLPAVLR